MQSGDSLPTGVYDIRRRLGTILMLSLIAIAITEIPAILFAASLARDNAGITGFAKAKCTVMNRTVEDSVCQRCYSDGCIDTPCSVPTFHIQASHMPREDLVIRTEGQSAASAASFRLNRYKIGKTYSCLYWKTDPTAVRFAPRHHGVYVAGVVISWGIIIIALVGIALTWFMR